MKKILTATLCLIACACGHRQADYYEKAMDCLKQQDAPQALHYLLLAAGSGGSDSLTAQVYSDIGYLYFEQGLIDKSLDAYRMAYHKDSLLDDSAAMAFDLRDIGNVYRTQEQDDSSLVYFSQALAMTADSQLRRDIESQMAAYHLWHGDYDEARRLLMPALAAADKESLSGLYYMAAELYAQTGHQDSAEHYYRKLLRVGTIDTRQAAHRALAQIAQERGDYAAAMRHLASYEDCTDSVISQNDAEAVRRVAALYDYSQRETENSQLRTQMLLAAIVIVALVGVIITGLLYYSRKRIRFQLRLKELEQLLAARQQLPESEVTDRQQAMACTGIYQLIQQRLGTPDCPPLKDSEWKQVEESVNTVYDGFTRRLYEFCHPSTQDYHVCLLLKEGIAPGDIAMLTARTKQAITNTRSRLFLKTFGRKGSPTEWDEFIHSL